ncbi:MAG: DedA family protein [Elusimicrobiaceae bacterium]|nr:DedA family protein [Elusimicrobiaceae bacterium]
MAEIHVLIILFVVGVTSAGFLPSQAEVVLFAVLATGEYRPWLLVLVTTAGNVVGSVGNYYLGKYILKFENKKWFPVKKKYLEKAENLFARHGPATLLLSGIPFIADPITVAAGMSKVKMWVFLPLVSISKACRYAVVWLLFIGIF